MLVSFKNNNYRESVIVNDQDCKFLLESKNNNFSYKFSNYNINNYYFNFFEKKGDKILYSKRNYDNIIIKKIYNDIIQYNSTKKHYIEIYFSLNFKKLNNSLLIFNVYNNNELLYNQKITNNYINFYYKLINYQGYNFIKIQIINKNKNNILCCVTCNKGYLYSYYFSLLKSNLEKKIIIKIYNNSNKNFIYSFLS